VPDGFFAGTLVTGWAAMLLMLIAGVPLYVCATASTPIAAAMMAKGLEPGAALVFLLAGPATNIATILVVRNLLGKRALVAYLSSIAVITLLLGAVVNVLYPVLGFDPTDMDVTPGAMDHGWIANAGGVVLALLLARSAWRLRLDRSLGNWLRRAGGPIGLDLTALPVKAVGIAFLALAYASTALTTVGPGETVFIERYGRIAQERSEPGAIVHAPWPFDTTVRVATGRIRSVEFGVDRTPIDDSTIDAVALREERLRITRLDAESETLTGDGLLLSIRFGVQYRVTDARAWHYGQSDPEGLVARLSQDGLRRAVAVREADAVLIGMNDAFVSDVEARLAADLERAGLGATLVGVSMHDVHALPAIHDSYRKLASAMEDARTAERKAKIERMETLSEARRIALQMTKRAEGERLLEVASARGVAAAFHSLVGVHALSPRIIEKSMLFDARERALRPDAEGKRRTVLLLGENIEPIIRLQSTDEPAPDAFGDILTPRR
jgi:regulator of protease activity HflC (stomatin/prohibitin superfamily)